MHASSKISQNIVSSPLIISSSSDDKINTTSQVAQETFNLTQNLPSPRPLPTNYDQIAPEYTALIQLLEPSKKDILNELKSDFRMFHNINRDVPFADMIRFLIPKCFLDFRKLKPESLLINASKEEKELFNLSLEQIYTLLMNAFFLGLTESGNQMIDSEKLFNENIIAARKVIKQIHDCFKESNQLRICNSLRNLSHITDILLFLGGKPEGQRLAAMKIEDIWKNPSPSMGFSSNELNRALQTSLDILLYDFDPARVSMVVPGYGENEKEKKYYISFCQKIHKLLKAFQDQNKNDIDCSTPITIAGMIYKEPAKSDTNSILTKHSEFMDYMEHLRVFNSALQMHVIRKKINRKELSDQTINNMVKFVKELLPMLLDFTHSDFPTVTPSSLKEEKLIQEITSLFINPIRDELEQFNKELDSKSYNEILKTADLIAKESNISKNSSNYAHLVVKLFNESMIGLHTSLNQINRVVSEKKEKLRGSHPALFQDFDEFQNIATWVQTIESILYIHLQVSSQILDELNEFSEHFYTFPKVKQKLPKKIKKEEESPLKENIPPISFPNASPAKEEPPIQPKVKIKTRPEKPVEEQNLLEAALGDDVEVDYTGLHPNLAGLLKGNLKYRKFVQLLQSFGCTLTGWGKHAVFQTAIGNKVPVPVHPGTDLKFGTALSILEKAVKDSNS